MTRGLSTKIGLRRPARVALLATACLSLCLALPASALALMSTGDGGWQWLDAQPQGNDLETVVALDAQHAVIGGDNGTLLTTTDGGATWDRHVPGVAGAHVASLTSAGSGGLWATVWWETNEEVREVLAHSTDGGATWATRHLGGTVTKVDFVDARHGWVLGSDGRQGGVWATTDGGATWTFHVVRGSWAFGSIDFVDAAHGWAAGDTSILDDPNAGTSAAIFVTSDGGVSWHKTFFSADSDQMNTVSFANTQDGWAVGLGSELGGAGTLVATTNGGATWSAQSAGTAWDLSGVTCVDAAHAWLPEGGSIYATTDGGADWTSHDSGLPSVRAVAFADDLDGYAVGSQGGLATTSDGGQSWQVRSSLTPAGGFAPLGAIAFPDAAHGWATGGGPLLSTTDGGATWSSQTLSAGLDTLSFPDAADGWGTGHYADPSGHVAVLHTSDGGQSWQTQFSASSRNADLNGVDAVDASHAWVSGHDNGRPNRAIVGRTTDGGASWVMHTLAHVTSAYTSVSFVDAGYGWIACTQSYDLPSKASSILRTTDGGRSWKLQDITRRTIALRDITFVDRLHGWAVGQNLGSGGACVVLTTRTGGRTWSMQRLSSPTWFAGQQVVFVDDSHGWIACGPVVYATTDGGLHWHLQRPGSVVNAVAFTDPTHGWAAVQTGDWTFGSGGILTTSTGGFPPAS